MRGRILLGLVLLLQGCTTKQKIAGGGVGLAVIGLGLTYSNEARSDEQVGTSGRVGIVLLLGGLLTAFIAGALDESDKKDPPKEITAARKPADDAKSNGETIDQSAAMRAQQKRDQAWTLTKQAQDAARVNDCAKVTDLSAQVGALDAEFFSDVFMKDIAVQQCFVPKEAPPAEGPPLPIPGQP